MRSKIIICRFKILIKMVCLLLFLTLFSVSLNAETKSQSIVVRPEMPLVQREVLVQKLQTITGWNDLKFDDEGFLRLENSRPSNGSATAREFLMKASTDEHLMVIEDASNRKDIVFCNVVEGRWVNERLNKPAVYVIQIDFADFDCLIGDKKALASFNEGWGLLHEISHVVNDSADAQHKDELGECEAFINVMRRECGLAERAEYFHTFYPNKALSEFSTKLVRLAFDMKDAKKKKRYWLMWDANVVGGLEKSQNIAAR